MGFVRLEFCFLGFGFSLGVVGKGRGRREEREERREKEAIQGCGCRLGFVGRREGSGMTQRKVPLD